VIGHLSKKLIVNADDFGSTSGVNKGIIQVFREGIVTSTSLVINGLPGNQEAIKLAKENPELAIGVHLNVTVGKPVLPVDKVPSLVDQSGLFRHPPPRNDPQDLFRKEWWQRLKIDEVESEARAQIDKVIEAGIRPSHIDSHHFALFAHPEGLGVIAKLAKEYDVVVRSIDDSTKKILRENGVLTPDYYIGEFFGKSNISDEKLATLLRGLKDGFSDLGAHPGFVDKNLKDFTSYTYEREKELKTLISARKYVDKLGIRLVDFKSIRS
jgi:predicted glycoside hydrolase/deacetylase ChbG (UPF0249 family)